MKLYNSSDSLTGPNFSIYLRPYILVGFSWSRDEYGWHVALCLGPLSLMYWRLK